MSFRVMLAGGGTGGHVYPLVAVAEELKRQAPGAGKDVAIQFIGDGEFMRKAAEELDLTYHRVMAPKWRRYFSVLNFLDLFKIPVGVAQAFFFVWTFMPDVMLVKGGYASFLPALAAKFLAVPLIVHESDSVPGKVNLIWGKLSRRVFVSFDYTRKYFRADRTELIGTPIRPAVVSIIDKTFALQSFGLKGDKPVVFISGGSQGAQSINEVVVSDLIEFIKKYSIIHQCGAGNLNTIDQQVKTIIKEEAASFGPAIEADYRLFGSLNEAQLAQAYSAADVVVSRAGSMIFELSVIGKPAIIIPFKDAAQNHQLINAREFESSGGIIVEQDNLTPHILLAEIAQAYEHREEISAKIKQFAKPDAAAIIAKELLQAA